MTRWKILVSIVLECFVVTGLDLSSAFANSETSSKFSKLAPTLMTSSPEGRDEFRSFAEWKVLQRQMKDELKNILGLAKAGVSDVISTPDMQHPENQDVQNAQRQALEKSKNEWQALLGGAIDLRSLNALTLEADDTHQLVTEQAVLGDNAVFMVVKNSRGQRFVMVSGDEQAQNALRAQLKVQNERRYNDSFILELEGKPVLFVPLDPKEKAQDVLRLPKRQQQAAKTRGVPSVVLPKDKTEAGIESKRAEALLLVESYSAQKSYANAKKAYGRATVEADVADRTLAQLQGSRQFAAAEAVLQQLDGRLDIQRMSSLQNLDFLAMEDAVLNTWVNMSIDTTYKEQGDYEKVRVEALQAGFDVKETGELATGARFEQQVQRAQQRLDRFRQDIEATDNALKAHAAEQQKLQAEMAQGDLKRQAAAKVVQDYLQKTASQDFRVDLGNALKVDLSTPQAVAAFVASPAFQNPQVMQEMLTFFQQSRVDARVPVMATLPQLLRMNELLQKQQEALQQEQDIQNQLKQQQEKNVTTFQNYVKALGVLLNIMSNDQDLSLLADADADADAILTFLEFLKNNRIIGQNPLSAAVITRNGATQINALQTRLQAALAADAQISRNAGEQQDVAARRQAQATKLLGVYDTYVGMAATFAEAQRTVEPVLKEQAKRADAQAQAALAKERAYRDMQAAYIFQELTHYYLQNLGDDALYRVDAIMTITRDVVEQYRLGDEGQYPMNGLVAAVKSALTTGLGTVFADTLNSAEWNVFQRTMSTPKELAARMRQTVEALNEDMVDEAFADLGYWQMLARAYRLQDAVRPEMEALNEKIARGEELTPTEEAQALEYADLMRPIEDLDPQWLQKAAPDLAGALQQPALRRTRDAARRLSAGRSSTGDGRTRGEVLRQRSVADHKAEQAQIERSFQDAVVGAHNNFDAALRSYTEVPMSRVPGTTYGDPARPLQVNVFADQGRAEVLNETDLDRLQDGQSLSRPSVSFARNGEALQVTRPKASPATLDNEAARIREAHRAKMEELAEIGRRRVQELADQEVPTQAVTPSGGRGQQFLENWPSVRTFASFAVFFAIGVLASMLAAISAASVGTLFLGFMISAIATFVLYGVSKIWDGAHKEEFTEAEIKALGLSSADEASIFKKIGGTGANKDKYRLAKKAKADAAKNVAAAKGWKKGVEALTDPNQQRAVRNLIDKQSPRMFQRLILPYPKDDKKDGYGKTYYARLFLYVALAALAMSVLVWTAVLMAAGGTTAVALELGVVEATVFKVAFLATSISVLAPMILFALWRMKNHGRRAQKKMVQGLKVADGTWAGLLASPLALQNAGALVQAEVTDKDQLKTLLAQDVAAWGTTDTNVARAKKVWQDLQSAQPKTTIADLTQDERALLGLTAAPLQPQTGTEIVTLANFFTHYADLKQALEAAAQRKASQEQQLALRSAESGNNADGISDIAQPRLNRNDSSSRGQGRGRRLGKGFGFNANDVASDIESADGYSDDESVSGSQGEDDPFSPRGRSKNALRASHRRLSEWTDSASSSQDTTERRRRVSGVVQSKTKKNLLLSKKSSQLESLYEDSEFSQEDEDALSDILSDVDSEDDARSISEFSESVEEEVIGDHRGSSVVGASYSATDETDEESVLSNESSTSIRQTATDRLAKKANAAVKKLDDALVVADDKSSKSSQDLRSTLVKSLREAASQKSSNTAADKASQKTLTVMADALEKSTTETLTLDEELTEQQITEVESVLDSSIDSMKATYLATQEGQDVLDEVFKMPEYQQEMVQKKLQKLDNNSVASAVGARLKKQSDSPASQNPDGLEPVVFKKTVEEIKREVSELKNIVQEAKNTVDINAGVRKGAQDVLQTISDWETTNTTSSSATKTLADQEVAKVLSELQVELKQKPKDAESLLALDMITEIRKQQKREDLLVQGEALLSAQFQKTVTQEHLNVAQKMVLSAVETALNKVPVTSASLVALGQQLKQAKDESAAPTAPKVAAQRAKIISQNGYIVRGVAAFLGIAGVLAGVVLFVSGMGAIPLAFAILSLSLVIGAVSWDRGADNETAKTRWAGMALYAAMGILGLGLTLGVGTGIGVIVGLGAMLALFAGRSFYQWMRQADKPETSVVQQRGLLNRYGTPLVNILGFGLLAVVAAATISNGLIAVAAVVGVMAMMTILYSIAKKQSSTSADFQNKLRAKGVMGKMVVALAENPLMTLTVMSLMFLVAGAGMFFGAGLGIGGIMFAIGVIGLIVRGLIASYSYAAKGFGYVKNRPMFYQKNSKTEADKDLEITQDGTKYTNIYRIKDDGTLEKAKKGLEKKKSKGYELAVHQATYNFKSAADVQAYLSAQPGRNIKLDSASFPLGQTIQILSKEPARKVNVFRTFLFVFAVAALVSGIVVAVVMAPGAGAAIKAAFVTAANAIANFFTTVFTAPSSFSFLSGVGTAVNSILSGLGTFFSSTLPSAISAAFATGQSASIGLSILGVGVLALGGIAVYKHLLWKRISQEKVVEGELTEAQAFQKAKEYMETYKKFQGISTFMRVSVGLASAVGAIMIMVSGAHLYFLLVPFLLLLVYHAGDLLVRTAYEAKPNTIAYKDQSGQDQKVELVSQHAFSKKGELAMLLAGLVIFSLFVFASGIMGVTLAAGVAYPILGAMALAYLLLYSYKIYKDQKVAGRSEDIEAMDQSVQVQKAADQTNNEEVAKIVDAANVGLVALGFADEKAHAAYVQAQVQRLSSGGDMAKAAQDELQNYIDLMQQVAQFSQAAPNAQDDNLSSVRANAAAIKKAAEQLVVRAALQDAADRLRVLRSFQLKLQLDRYIAKLPVPKVPPRPSLTPSSSRSSVADPGVDVMVMGQRLQAVQQYIDNRSQDTMFKTDAKLLQEILALPGINGVVASDFPALRAALTENSSAAQEIWDKDINVALQRYQVKRAVSTFAFRDKKAKLLASVIAQLKTLVTPIQDMFDTAEADAWAILVAADNAAEFVEGFEAFAGVARRDIFESLVQQLNTQWQTLDMFTQDQKNQMKTAADASAPVVANVAAQQQRQRALWEEELASRKAERFIRVVLVSPAGNQVQDIDVPANGFPVEAGQSLEDAARQAVAQLGADISWDRAAVEGHIVPGSYRGVVDRDARGVLTVAFTMKNRLVNEKPMEANSPLEKRIHEDYSKFIEDVMAEVDDIFDGQDAKNTAIRQAAEAESFSLASLLQWAANQNNKDLTDAIKTIFQDQRASVEPFLKAEKVLDGSGQFTNQFHVFSTVADPAVYEEPISMDTMVKKYAEDLRDPNQIANVAKNQNAFAKYITDYMKQPNPDKEALQKALADQKFIVLTSTGQAYELAPNIDDVIGFDAVHAIQDKGLLVTVVYSQVNKSENTSRLATPTPVQSLATTVKTNIISLVEPSLSDKEKVQKSQKTLIELLNSYDSAYGYAGAVEQKSHFATAQKNLLTQIQGINTSSGNDKDTWIAFLKQENIIDANGEDVTDTARDLLNKEILEAMETKDLISPYAQPQDSISPKLSPNADAVLQSAPQVPPVAVTITTIKQAVQVLGENAAKDEAERDAAAIKQANNFMVKEINSLKDDAAIAAMKALLQKENLLSQTEEKINENIAPVISETLMQALLDNTVLKPTTAAPVIVSQDASVTKETLKDLVKNLRDISSGEIQKLSDQQEGILQIIKALPGTPQEKQDVLAEAGLIASMMGQMSISNDIARKLSDNLKKEIETIMVAAKNNSAPTDTTVLALADQSKRGAQTIQDNFAKLQTNTVAFKTVNMQAPLATAIADSVDAGITNAITVLTDSTSLAQANYQMRFKASELSADVQAQLQAKGMAVDAQGDYVFAALDATALKKTFDNIEFHYDNQMSNAASFQRKGKTLVIHLNAQLKDKPGIQELVQKFVMHELVETMFIAQLEALGVWDDLSTKMGQWRADTSLEAIKLKAQFEGTIDAMAYNLLPVQVLQKLQGQMGDLLEFELELADAFLSSEDKLIAPKDGKSVADAQMNAMAQIAKAKADGKPLDIDQFAKIAQRVNLAA